MFRASEMGALNISIWEKDEIWDIMSKHQKGRHNYGLYELSTNRY